MNENHDDRTKHGIVQEILGLGLIAMLVSVGILAYRLGQPFGRDDWRLHSSLATGGDLTAGDAHPRAQMLVPPHLEWADAECERLIEEHLKTLEEFFAQAKDNIPGFTVAVLGWKSKWRLITDRVPLVGTDHAHREFLTGCLHRYLFTPNALEAEIAKAIKGYLEAVRDIESLMLVRIQQDVAGFPGDFSIAHLDPSQLQAVFEQSLKLASKGARVELRDEVIRQIVALVTGEVLTAVTLRLGVSAGILATGTVSGVATFGIGLGVGFAADQVVGWAWERMSDPQGQLAKKIQDQVEALQRLVVEGDETTLGIRRQLEAFANKRGFARRSAVRTLVEATGGER